ncbi:MAG TPA: type 1 glutamine amidotransferase [Candidatus Sulfotelmatobacter sp.]|jgi:GMP synthase (glutamine-hydrolysing)|nr:type 1 glutamine amidotransferase [Candidatus Sulfotelmatobacter sp.]
MLIGILETGRPAPSLAAEHGTYTAMVATLLSAGDGVLQFENFAVLENEFPESVEACDGYVVTGSRFSAMDETPWMLHLEQFLRDAVDKDRPVFGICFGHQILAKALGGEVRQAEQGWQLGLKTYQVVKRPDWMADAPDTLRINAIHQDQVVRAPDGAEIIATSPQCPVAGLVYGDKAVSLQAHPEFTLDFEKDLLKTYTGVTLPKDLGKAAQESVKAKDAETDSLLIAHLIRRFFLRHPH